MTARNKKGRGAEARQNLSPSLNHRYLLDRLTPRLSFEGGDVAQWQRRLRKKFRELTGYDQFPRKPSARGPLNVRSLWKRDHPLGTIEKLVFTSEPCSDVPAFLCLPRHAAPPHPTFVCLQGHSTGMHNSIAVDREDNAKPIQVAGDRDFGLGCLRRGIAALCLEQRSFGERREQAQQQVAQHGCQDATMHALMLGRTLQAERVFDVDRGIDYLATRGEIDMKRIGVMGNSGGGTVAVNAAALLPGRIAFCMPSCYFCTYRDSIMSIKHCVDNYVPGLLQYAEMWDILGLFAPQPVVIVAGKDDQIFPIRAVRRSFRQLKEIYRAAGAPESCKLVVGPEGHRFYADLAWPKMMRFVQASVQPVFNSER